jgi:lipopolysaccharide transport system ATP-binding protein
MSDYIIKVENLSKKYSIRHQQPERYTALRDIIAHKAAAPLRWLRGQRGVWSNGHGANHNGNGSSPPSLLLRLANTEAPTSQTEEFWALKDLSFEIKAGEVLGIIGRNGAGKSTLLKILSRITDPTEGCVRIRGRVASLLEVGTGFHPELTGRENIFVNGAILGMTRAEVKRKFDEIVAFAEVEKFLDTPVKHYSSGMHVRLAFAVAAHLDPEILLVDEVLAVGDAEFQKKCLGKMEDVANTGRTIMFVSHNMNAVEQLCTRAILLNRGEIAAANPDVRAVTTEYLFGNEFEAHDSSEWVNTNNEFSNSWFKPLGFRVCDREGNPLVMPLKNTADMWVQIEGDIEIIDPSLFIGYAIYSETGILLYSSYQTDQQQRDWPKVTKGRNVLRGRIPSRFLNEGTYRVELIGGLYYRLWLFQPGHNVPAIYLKIQGGLSDSPYWTTKRSGETAPLLEWVHVQPAVLTDNDRHTSETQDFGYANPLHSYTGRR